MKIPFKMSHIEAKSIENWPRYQLKYEFMPFPNTHWHACQVFWLISQPIINGFCFKIIYSEGMNMAKSIFEYWIFVLVGNIFEYSNYSNIHWELYSTHDMQSQRKTWREQRDEGGRLWQVRKMKRKISSTETQEGNWLGRRSCLVLYYNILYPQKPRENPFSAFYRN